MFEAIEKVGMAPIYYVYNGLLCVLQVLHIFWFMTIVKMAYGFIVSGEVSHCFCLFSNKRVFLLNSFKILPFNPSSIISIIPTCLDIGYVAHRHIWFLGMEQQIYLPFSIFPVLNISSCLPLYFTINIEVFGVVMRYCISNSELIPTHDSSHWINLVVNQFL